MIADLPEDSASQWDGDPDAAAQGGRVEPGRKCFGRREGSLDTLGDISDHIGRNAQLAVGEMLEQHGSQKRVVRNFDPDHDR